MKYTKYFGRRTKIVCTIGPASSTAAMIERLIKTGMNIARLNLSHGTHSEHAHHIEAIGRLAERLGIPVPILMDLPGPKYRSGRLRGGSVVLKKDAQVTLTSRQVEGDEETVPVTLPTLPQNVKVGDMILLDDGAIQLRVREISGTEVKSRVVIGGLLASGRGIVVPGMRASDPFVTEHLREHIDFAIEQQPDYIALSFVSRAADVSQTRAVLRQKNCDIPIIAKIERGQAVVNLNRILAVSDGIMVARGDLGVDIPLQRVPLVQKEIIKQCNQAGKPVITATQMLESMVTSARPTRAEVSDIANAIFDGTDAVMLSAETSLGKYPVEAVRMMAQVARETEGRLPYEKLLIERGMCLEPETDELISYNACHTANRLGAAAIVAFTESGSTARRVSKYRPRMPILAITTSKLVRRRLQLCWGVQAFQIAGSSSVDQLFTTAAKLSKDLGLAKSGDLIVITGGIPIGVAGTTNLLKVEKIP
ncbi:MAG: pyruvate kinase [Dehalococcoidia bacterium]